MTNRLESFPELVIAAVNAYALGGGCELALACDIRLASERAQLGLPEVNIRILPGWGRTQRGARATSPGFAKGLIFTGRRVDAAAKGVVNLALEGDLQGHPARELDAFAPAFTTEDQREGMATFFEKRTPEFRGR